MLLIWSHYFVVAWDCRARLWIRAGVLWYFGYFTVYFRKPSTFHFDPSSFSSAGLNCWTFTYPLYCSLYIIMNKFTVNIKFKYNFSLLYRCNFYGSFILVQLYSNISLNYYLYFQWYHISQNYIHNYTDTYRYRFY